MLTLCCTAAFLFVCLFLCVWDCFACAYVPGTDLFFLFFFFSFFFHGMVRVFLSWLLFLFFVYGHVVFDFFSVLLNRFLVSFRIRFLLFFLSFRFCVDVEVASVIDVDVDAFIDRCLRFCAVHYERGVYLGHFGRSSCLLSCPWS